MTRLKLFQKTMDCRLTPNPLIPSLLISNTLPKCIYIVFMPDIALLVMMDSDNSSK